MKGYQIKITIKGSKPPIWRKVIVPDKISFANLDDVIECIFGWEHAHLYEFYFPKDGVRISMPNEFGDGFADDFADGFSAKEECIDNWLDAGEKFEYIYDFGDDWIHTVLVEELVSYENRYAQVVKSKGPYMIEDCGGIWGFSACMDQADDFDINEANERLKNMEFEEFEECEECKKPNQSGWNRWKELNGQKDFIKELLYEMAGGKNIPPLELPMKSVFADYKKDDLVMIAKLHGFTGYSKFNKKGLAEWLSARLLEPGYMKQMLEGTVKEEIQHFEAAMEGGDFISEELVSESLFLSTYGAYNESISGLQIPKDVRESYQELCTPEFRKRLEKNWKLTDYCNSAVYLYGIVPVSKVAEIYRQYTKEDITEDAIYDLAQKQGGGVGIGLLHEGLLMEDQFLEDNLYQWVLEDQEKMPFYIPEDEEEYLMYGEKDCQEPDGHTEGFIVYLQNKYGLEYVEAIMAFYELQSAVRANYQIPQLMDMLEDILDGWDKKLNRKKDIKEAEDQLKNLQNYTRAVRYRGHTRKEYLNMQYPEQMRKGKVIAFPGSKKIYPNDPCPCGSGKKYKKCCGKNKTGN